MSQNSLSAQVETGRTCRRPAGQDIQVPRAAIESLGQLLLVDSSVIRTGGRQIGSALRTRSVEASEPGRGISRVDVLSAIFEPR